jgi:MFS family permease
MPVAALLFVLIPHAAVSLPLLIAVMFSYALVANSFKPIAESLLPDYIGPERRSRANAAVKIASSITVIVAALISLFLIDDFPKLSFAIPAVLMLVSVGVLGWRVRDSRYQAALEEDRSEMDAGPRVRMRDVLLDIVRDADRSRLLVILAVFAFGGAWFASRSLVTNYGLETLGLSRGDAGGLTLPSGLAFIAAAYPVALLAERFGRLRMILIGMAVFATAVVLGTLVRTPTGTVVAMCVAAAGAAAFMVNMAVVLWNLAPSARVLGTYTGLYTVGWSAGGFVGPALVGGMVDVTGWPFMLLDVGLVTAVAVLLVARVAVLQRRSPDGHAL